MSSSETQQNGFGDSVRIESAAGILPLSEVSGDEDHQKDYPIISKSQESQKVSDMTNSVPEESSRRPSTEDNVQQDELLFPVTPPVSDETDLDFAEQSEDALRIFHLGPTNSLTRASSTIDNNWIADWGSYILSHGVYMAFLSFIYLILVYASLELLYYFTNKKSN